MATGHVAEPWVGAADRAFATLFAPMLAAVGLAARLGRELRQRRGSPV